MYLLSADNCFFLLNSNLFMLDTFIKELGRQKRARESTNDKENESSEFEEGVFLKHFLFSF
jgi:hypothetical protein